MVGTILLVNRNTNQFSLNLLNKQVANLTNKKHLPATGKLKWTTSPVDLILGSSFGSLAVAEVHASSDGKKKFAEIMILAMAT